MRTFIRAVTGLVFSVAACSTYGTSVVEVQKTPAKVASVAISVPLSLVAGQSARATATPKDASGNALTDREVSWYSSSASVANVTDSGVISAVAPGTAVVSAVSEGISGQATMAVTPPPPTPIANLSVSLNPATVTVGGTAQATATLQDSSGSPVTGQPITWESSDITVATVDATGKVKGVKAGNSMIKASAGGKSNASALSVNAPAPIPVASVTVSPSSPIIQIGATTQLSATTRDGSGNVLTGRSISWSSSNTSIATVTGSGLVTAVAAGSASVTATSEGQTGSSTVTVSSPPPPPVPVASVSVSPASATLAVGATQQLSATTRDGNNNVLTGRVISWSSSNTSIARVSTSGLVTAVAAGSATITATSEGQTGTSAITVNTPPPVPVGSVSVSPSSATITVGGTQQLSATTRDANGNVLTGRVVSWSSGNTAIATVNSNTGLVTAVAVGTIQVTATSETKTGTASITVQAVPPPPPPGSSNEPSGMTMIRDRDFSALQDASWDTDNILSIVQDPTAPKSPSSVIRVTFPTGFAGGSSNGHTGTQWGGGSRILYISYWMKYSSNWWGHNTGINKQAYAWVTEGGGYTPFVMEAEGTDNGPLKPRPILQRMIVGDGNYEPNLVPSATIQRGQWFHIECVLTGNTSGSANGAMDIYLDGVHVTSVGGLQWTNGTTSWNIFELYPVWGGIGDVVPATMTADWDHVYLSGK